MHMCIKGSRQLIYQPPNPKPHRQLAISLKIQQNSEQMCIDLESKNKDLEQYTRTQNLRISGIQENAGENTDDLVLNFFIKTHES